MIGNLLSIPVLLLLFMLQIGIFSQLRLLNGTADLVLIGLAAWAMHDKARSAWVWALVAGAFAAFTSALPLWVLPASYLFVVLAARLLIRQVWQVPLMAMFLVTLIGTFVQHILSIAGLVIGGSPIPFSDSLSLVLLPSALLNLLLALPIYTFIHDLAHWVYPVEFES